MKKHLDQEVKMQGEKDALVGTDDAVAGSSLKKHQKVEVEIEARQSHEKLNRRKRCAQ